MHYTPPEPAQDPAFDVDGWLRAECERSFTLAVLDCVLRSKIGWLSYVRGWFELDWILDPFHREVCRALFSIAAKRPCTTYEIAESLYRTGSFAGVCNLAELVSSLGDSLSAQADHIRYYGLKVYEFYRRRAAAAETSEVASTILADPDAGLDALPEIRARYQPLELDRRKDILESVDRVLAEKYGRGEHRLETGIPELDRVLHGIGRQSSVIIGAQTGGGKSAMLGQIALNIAKSEGPVTFHALEMSNEEMIARWCSVLSRHAGACREFIAAAAELRGMLDGAQINLFSNARSLDQIENDIRAAHDTSPLAAIFVDYLQVIAWKGKGRESRQEIVDTCARRLKALAMDLRVPVFSGAQLRRDEALDPSKKAKPGDMPPAPKTRHLRESGGIEQNADVVLLMNSPNTDATLVPLDVIIAKNRHGPVSTVRTEWRKPIWFIGRMPKEKEGDHGAMDDGGGSGTGSPALEEEG